MMNNKQKKFISPPHKLHIGLNAQLLELGHNYRSAGISTYIYHLIRHLSLLEQFQMTVWTGERSGDLGKITRLVTALPTNRPPVRILWEQLLQPYAVAQIKPDLLHGMAFVLPLWLKLPSVITIYDLTFFHLPQAFRPLNRLYLQTMSRLSAQRASHICSIAAHGKADIVRHLKVPASKVTVVYPGLSPHFMKAPTTEEIAEFRRRKGLPEHYILYLGTLEPRKNVPTLLRAFGKLHKERALPGVKLILAGGKGWGYDEIFAETERLGLKDVVDFPGFVPTEEQALWYAAAELFVFPSRYEGFGLPPLEAMACGTAVITSNVTSLTEVVGEAGMTVSPEDEEALSHAIIELLNNPEELAVRQAAGLAQAAHFQWHKSALTQAQVYHQVMAER